MTKSPIELFSSRFLPMLVPGLGACCQTCLAGCATKKKSDRPQCDAGCTLVCRDC